VQETFPNQAALASKHVGWSQQWIAKMPQKVSGHYPKSWSRPAYKNPEYGALDDLARFEQEYHGTSSDWCWLGKPETKKLLQHYGTNEKDWEVNFGIAWNNISCVGWEPHLVKCRKVSCSVSSKSITCPAGSSIEFPLANCAPTPHLYLSAKC